MFNLRCSPVLLTPFSPPLARSDLSVPLNIHQLLFYDKSFKLTYGGLHFLDPKTKPYSGINKDK